MTWDTAGKREWAPDDDKCAANRQVPELLAGAYNNIKYYTQKQNQKQKQTGISCAFLQNQY